MYKSNVLVFTFRAFFFFAILAIIFSCNQKKQNPNEVNVSGVISNPTGDSVFIKLLPAIGWDYIKHGSLINEDGSFQVRFNIENPKLAEFIDCFDVQLV